MKQCVIEKTALEKYSLETLPYKTVIENLDAMIIEFQKLNNEKSQKLKWDDKPVSNQRNLI